MPFLLHLADHQGWFAPTAVAGAIGCQAKYAVGIAKRLKAVALVELREAGHVAGKPIYVTRITERGRELATMLRPVVAFLENDVEDRSSSRRRPSHK